ncbi:MAG: OadG family protein [Clostridiaceae bacterium]|nr:OadG family protein [Clostridiaceae bacterium]
MRTFEVVLVGMVVVFAVLILLSVCIKIYSAIVSRISSRKNGSGNNDNPVKKNVSETTVVNPSPVLSQPQQGLNPEVIAVIAAAIAASMGGSGSDIKVRSIRRIGHTTPIWNVAGRNEYILTRL